MRSGVILSVPHVPQGKLRFGARLVHLAKEVASQLLRQGGDKMARAVCEDVVGVHYDAVLSARSQTTVLTHGGGQVSGDKTAID